jgi:hypothetical protein
MADSDKGRKGDTVLGHLTKGEIVIPKQFAEDKDFRDVVTAFMRENGVDIDKFVVGNKKNSINPETGNVEFGFFSKVFKSVSKAFSSIFGKPKIPKPPPKPSPAPRPAKLDPDIKASSEKEQRRRRALRGRQSTILTGAIKLTGNKSILGR